MNIDQVFFYNKGFNDCLAKNIQNNLAKDLTDAEIDSLIAEVAEKPTDEDLYDFAKAILRKAQDK
jgi:hypothetical protein